MIKLFGKVRYHWQPELSYALIYWCLAISPIFVSLALLYERTKISTLSFVLFIIFIVLLGIGLHRFFEIVEGRDELRITGTIPSYSGTIAISSISKIQISKHSLIIFSSRWPNGKLFYMRKWYKKYFVDALTITPFFRGEVELIGHADDYFHLYTKKA